MVAARPKPTRKVQSKAHKYQPEYLLVNQCIVTYLIKIIQEIFSIMTVSIVMTVVACRADGHSIQTARRPSRCAISELPIEY